MALLILEVKKCCGTKALGLQVKAGMGLCVRAFASICGAPSLSGPGSYARSRGPGACSRHQFWFPGSRPADLVRVRVRARHRVEQGLVLVVGRGGARRAWVRRILGKRTAHRAARSAPMAWALRARAPAAARPRRVTSWVGCHASAKKKDLRAGGNQMVRAAQASPDSVGFG